MNDIGFSQIIVTKLLNLKTIDYFRDQALRYYPENIHESDGKYLKTEQYLKLKQKIEKCNSNKSNLNSFIISLENNLPNKLIYENKMGSNYPCHEIQISIQETNELVRVIAIYISFLIPYYYICELNGLKENKKIIHKTYKNIDGEEKIIREKLNSFFKYKNFPDELIFSNIKNIIVLEKFNMFNAFFNDAFRIFNF